MTRSSLDCYKSFFVNLYQSYGPLFMPKLCFHTISWELLDIYSPNFIYAVILTRSSLRLLHIIFQNALKKGDRIRVFCLSVCSFVRPSVCSPVIIFSFPLNIFRTLFIEFIQILYENWLWHDLPWDCYRSFFPHLYQSYGPWFTSKFHFSSISWDLLDIFSPNFIYAFMLTRSSLGLLHVIFRKFVPELWPFIYAKILFPFNILINNW